jgi:hypothetical protein
VTWRFFVNYGQALGFQFGVNARLNSGTFMSKVFAACFPPQFGLGLQQQIAIF